METGDVIIQEPISTKTSIEEASAGVVLLDHLSMEIADKVKMSSVLDDEITSSTIIPGKEDVTEVVNGSGHKETEESEREKGEAKKTILVKEKASETEKDEQGSIYVHEPENAEDAKIILSDVTLEKEKDDGITQKPEEVIFEKSVTEEDQTETKHAAEQEKEMNNIPEVLVDKSPVKIDEDETEKSLVPPHEKILIKRSDEENVTKDETDEEKDSRSVETSVNETGVVHNAMVPVEEISSNIVKEDDREGEKEETVEATKYIDDAEKISHKVTADREKEEDITRKVEEVQESPSVIETPTVQGENIESNVSKDTDEHEHVLVREMAQSETLVTEAEAVNTPTVQVVEDHAETKHSAEQEEEMDKISKVMSDTAPVKSEEDAIEKSLNSAGEEDILTKTDEVKEEEESRTGETSVHGSEAEHTATNPVEDVLTNTVKETVPEKDTATYGESLGDVETTTRVLEDEKYAETKFDAKEKDEGETVKEGLFQEIVNSEETTVQESESSKENAEKISHEVEVEREKEEDVTPNTEEPVRESPREIETPTIKGEDIESKASLDHEEEAVESSRETKEHEHGETRGETVDISKTLETKEDTETSPDLKEDKGEETVLPSNGVESSNVEAEEFGEHTEPCSSEIKEESHRREESVEVKSKKTVQDEITEDNLVDVLSKETEKYEDKDPETALDANTESTEKCDEAQTVKDDKEQVKDDKIEKDEVDGTQTVEKQIGLDSNEPEAEQTDENRNDETGESPAEKLAALPDVESLSQVSESVDEKIEEKPEEEVTPQQEGSYGIETDSVQKSSELGEKVGEERSVIDLTPPQKEPRLPNEQAQETKVQEEEIEKHEQTNVEVKSGEEGETVIAAEKTENIKADEEEHAADKIENIKADEEEQAADKIQKNLETVETVDSSLPPSSEEQEHGPVSETVKDEEVEDAPLVQIKREGDAIEGHERKDEFSKTGETTVVEVEETREIVPSLTADEEITVREMPQDETTVDACTIQEAAISKTPETNILESKAVPGPIGLKEESQETKEDSEPSLDLKDDKEQEDPKTITTEISSDEVKSCDVQAEEFGEHCHLPEIKDDGQGTEVKVEAKPKEIVQDESTQVKDENLLDAESSETMQKTSSSQEEDSYESDTKEEPCLPNEQETKLQKEQIEKHEPKHEEVSSDQKSPGEEKFDEISKVSSASLSEEREGETIVEGEKIEDIKTNEAEQESDKIQKSLEAVDIAEPHISLPSSSEKQEHGTFAEAEMKEDDKVEEAEPTSLMLSEKIVEAKKADEEMMISGLDGSGTSKSSESVCIKQDEFDNLSETTKATEASNNQTETPSSELVSEQNDQTSMLVEEIHEVPKESSSEVPVSMLAPKEDYQEGDVTEIKETEPERPVSTETEETTEETKPKESVDETRNDTLTAEVKRGDEAVKELETTEALDSSGTLKTPEEEEFRNPGAPKQEESKEDKSQDILPTETSQADRTLASELVSDQTPKMAEEEEKETHKLQVADDQILPVETLQEDQNPSFVSELENQIPKQVEEVYEEETKEAHKLQFPVETSQVEQTASLVLEQDDQTSKLANLQASFSEAPVSKLASGEEELVNLEEGGDTQEERHVSAETKERVGETKPEANDQVKTSTQLTKEEDENRKITNGQSISNSPEDACLKQEELKDTETTEDQSPLRNDNQDYPTGEAEQEDESSSTLPVVEILKGLHTTLETEREIIDSTSSGETMIREPTEEVQKTSDAEVISNEKDSAAEIIEANRLQEDESGETEKIQEEKSLPIEELKLQEEDKEEVQVEDSIRREFEVSVKEKLQEEETSREIAEKQDEHEAKEDTNASKQERISLQEEHPRDSEISDEVMESDLPADLLHTEKKTEINKTVEEEQEIVDVKEEQKDAEVQDEKFGGLSATREVGESNLSEMKKDQEDASELGALPDFQVEKVEESQSELIQPQPSPNQLEESSFTVSKAEEDSKEDTSDALITNENVQVEDQPKNFEGPVEDKETSEQEQELNDLTHVQEDIGTDYKLQSDGHDSVVAQKEETNSLEEKKEVEYVKAEPENAIKNGVSTEEECFNSTKNTDDATEKTEPEIQEIENLSSVRDIQNISKEIEEPQQETLRIAQELQKKDGESENSKDLFSEVKDSEPTMQELEKKSLSGENIKTEPTEKVHNPNGAEEEKEEVKLEDSTSREFEVSVKEKLQEEETRESTVEKKEHKAQEDGNASTEEVVCLQAEHPRDLEILDQVMEPELPADMPHTEKKTEIDETVEEEQRIVDAKEEKKSAEVQDEKLEGVYVTKDAEETFSSEVKKDQENASKLGVGQGFTSLQVEKQEEPQSVKEKLQEEETREVAEKQKEDKAQEVGSASTVEVISLQEKQPRDFEISPKVGDNSVQVLESEVPADLPRTEMKTQIDETVEKEDQFLNIKEVMKSEDVQDEKIEGVSPTKDTEETFSSEVKKDQENASKLGVGHDFTSPQVEKEEEPHSVLVNDEEKQTKDLVGVTKNAEQESKEEHVETQAIADDTKAKNDTDFQIREADADKFLTKEALDDQIQVPSLAAPGDQDLSVKQQSEHIQLQQSPNQVEETSFKASDALIKTENTSNKTEKNKASEKIDHDASKETEETKPDISEIENLSYVSDKSMIAEELQQKHGESENTKDTFSEVKDSEPTTKEPARKSLSDLIPTVKGTTNKTEEEERKTEEEDEDGDEHKDDKTSPDSLVMVEAKDTVHIIKTQHKKSHGILSGVGSKVKHSISKVKKALIGKSSHTTKPSSPK